MSKIIAWFVHNPVAANLLMTILVVGGLLSIGQLTEQEYPEMDLKIVYVRIPYMGAAPEEVEKGVCIRAEEAIEGTDQIKRISSLSSEGSCTIYIELINGAEEITALNEIKGRIDAISTFPSETERPIVSLITSLNNGFEIAISGNASERTLKNIAVNIREDLAGMDGISQVEVVYVRDDEISIEVSEQSLRRYGINISQIVNAIKSSSLDLPGGSIQAEIGEILVRTNAQAYLGEEFENIVIIANEDGTVVRLGEIADVIDGFVEGDLDVSFDGNPAAMVSVFQTPNEDIIDMRDKVYSYIEEAQSRMPQGITLTIWDDQSKQLRARINILLGTAAGGLVLVLILLTLPLQFKLAIWVAAGIPIAMLGTIALFNPFSLTLNTMSIMAFLLVLGIVVDDAIVVGERVFAHEKTTKNKLEAAIEGTSEVAVPVIFGVLTTIAAFIPIIFLEGAVGSLFSGMGKIVVICLVFSIIESQLILPAHLAYRNTKKSSDSNPLISKWIKFQSSLSDKIEYFASFKYAKILDRILQKRYLTMSCGLAVLMIIFSMLFSGRISVQFLPTIVADRVTASLDMPEGVPIELTSEAAHKIEDAAIRLKAYFSDNYPNQDNPIQHILTSVGQRLSNDGPGGVGTGIFRGVNSHIAQVAIGLTPQSQRRNFPTEEIMEMWREYTGIITDSVELKFSATLITAGDAINIRLRGRDVEELGEVAARLRSEISRFDGVSDISDTYRSGKQEVRLKLREDAAHLGLSEANLARQARQAFYGEEVQRVQRGTEDVRVMVRYPEDERRSLGDLEEMWIRLNNGTEIPFSAAAEYTLDTGYSSIWRIDRQRIITVRADVDRSINTPEEIYNALESNTIPIILSEYDGVSYTKGGEAEEANQAFGGIINLFPVALLVIYSILAIPLRSYLQPAVIMSVIPFGAVGAIIGHVVMGWAIVLPSILGIIALSGVVVNASLVLVDYINRQRRKGIGLEEAVRQAGIVRFRPIVLTSMTTFGGLMPLMLIENPSTAFIVPMAISLGWGVIVATVITLFLVPSLYLILEDFFPTKNIGAK
ncbi:MAG: hypothetical protein CBC38_01435 [Gammaproteobacteria bacterium TMED78]|nr:MAG: hypothetical protein CBC38_01435 [Gammaproteobacteria bacterium TMED78]|tara:strand:+ start:47784 stop:50942 length:3159 start_codon:yes stop_codon:yes gene_type:complete